VSERFRAPRSQVVDECIARIFEEQQRSKYL